MKKTTKTNKRKRTYSKITSLLLLILLLSFFIMLGFLNIISIVFLIIAFLIIGFIYLLLVKLSFSRKRVKRITGNCIMTILILILLFGNHYVINTLDFFNNAFSTNKKIETYNVIVLNSSNYEELADLEDETIGTKNDKNYEGLKKAKKKITKKSKVEYQDFDDVNELSEALIDEKVEAIILENAEMKLIEEDNYDIYKNFKIIYSIEITTDVKDNPNSVNILKKPFNIYISGVDTYGKINSATRSDVNILLTVNPETAKIHMTWIPRDYYVAINDSTYKDKLTHAGIYGIDKSIYAVENVLDTKVNYYVKINFTSLVNIVNTLGDITVYNDHAFTSQDKIRYKKGEITLNGEEALSFVRERKNVPGGDEGRGKNQLKVLQALIEKAKSPKIIVKYNSLLNALDKNFVSNLEMNNVIKYIEKEIKKPKDYEITSYTLTGTGAYDYTYSYKSKKLYVMKSDSESVDEGRKLIDDIINPVEDN